MYLLVTKEVQDAIKIGAAPSPAGTGSRLSPGYTWWHVWDTALPYRHNSRHSWSSHSSSKGSLSGSFLPLNIAKPTFRCKHWMVPMGNRPPHHSELLWRCPAMCSCGSAADGAKLLSDHRLSRKDSRGTVSELWKSDSKSSHLIQNMAKN